MEKKNRVTFECLVMTAYFGEIISKLRNFLMSCYDFMLLVTILI